MSVQSSIAATTDTPLLAAVLRLEADLRAMAAQVDAWSGLDGPTLRTACTTLRRARASIDGHLATATQALERSGTARGSGATSTGALLSRDFGGDRRAAEASIRTGRQLEESNADQTRNALVNGRLTRRQADAISGGLLQLPKDLPAAERAACERSLIDQAQDLSLGDLRRACDRATAPVEPIEAVDGRENALVEARERRAWRATELWLSDQGDGTTTGRFRIPTAQATMLSALLEAQAAPRRSHLTGAEDPDTSENLTFAQRFGRAFCAMIEHVPTDGYATSGGTAASVTVTMDLATLTLQLDDRVALLPHGAALSAGQARRLACSHGIIPQVLGGESLPLDLGRSQRLFSPAQRKALAQRDHGCAFPGCDRPPGWCEAHHIVPFGNGGTTDLGNGVLLCARHHHLVHDDRWSLRISRRTGLAEFAPPGTSRWRSSTRYRVKRRPRSPISPSPQPRSRPPESSPSPQPLRRQAPPRTHPPLPAAVPPQPTGCPRSASPPDRPRAGADLVVRGAGSAGTDGGQLLELLLESECVPIERQVSDGA